jgi:hypothetical protein
MTKDKPKETEKLNIDTIKNARERIEALKEKMKAVKTIDKSTKTDEEELIKIII